MKRTLETRKGISDSNPEQIYSNETNENRDSRQKIIQRNKYNGQSEEIVSTGGARKDLTAVEQ